MNGAICFALCFVCYSEPSMEPPSFGLGDCLATDLAHDPSFMHTYYFVSVA